MFHLGVISQTHPLEWFHLGGGFTRGSFVKLLSGMVSPEGGDFTKKTSRIQLTEVSFWRSLVKLLGGFTTQSVLWTYYCLHATTQ